jgi:hypothetical protein
VLKRLVFAIAPLILATVASAQHVEGPVELSPTAPTERDQITVRFTVWGFCGIERSTTVVGTLVRTTINLTGCIIGPPPGPSPNDAVFGPLPANTYTYELYFTYEGGSPQLVSRQPLVVSAAPPIPALSGLSLVVLTVALIGVALTALSGATGP